MTHNPRDPQTRLPLTRALADHDQRCAGTLVNLQIHPTVLTAAETIGLGAVSSDIDVIKGNTSGGAFNVTLPRGTPEIAGHIYEALKSAGSAAFGFALQGDDTFEDAATTFTNSTTDASVRTYWDGALWRKVGGATGGTLPAASSGTLGDGTGSPSMTMSKSATGTASVQMKVGATLRGQVLLDASENVKLAAYDGSGVEIGSILFDNATGAITLSKGTTVTAGGLTVTGLGVFNNGLRVATGQNMTLPLANYADNAAAVAGGLYAGQLYQTAGAVRVVL